MCHHAHVPHNSTYPYILSLSPFLPPSQQQHKTQEAGGGRAGDCPLKPTPRLNGPNLI